MEFGIIMELGATKIRHKLAELESDSAYPQSLQLMAQSVREQVGVLDKRLAECERQFARQSKSDPAVARLRSRPGSGPLTAAIIDVRTPEEFAVGHIDGAISIPYEQIGQAIQSVKGLKKDSPILVCCRSGRRSAVAKSALEQQGYKRIMDGGAMDVLISSL